MPTKMLMETMLKPSLVVDHLLQTTRAVIHQANPGSLWAHLPHQMLILGTKEELTPVQLALL